MLVRRSSVSMAARLRVGVIRACSRGSSLSRPSRKPCHRWRRSTSFSRVLDTWQPLRKPLVDLVSTRAMASRRRAHGQHTHRKSVVRLFIMCALSEQVGLLWSIRQQMRKGRECHRAHSGAADWAEPQCSRTAFQRLIVVTAIEILCCKHKPTHRQIGVQFHAALCVSAPSP